MMSKRGMKLRPVKATTLAVVGVALVLFAAVILLWHGNANSMQATPALVAQVYFDGEYRITDGEWQEIEKGSNWDGRSAMEPAQSGLLKIQCTDGYMEYADGVWKEVKA